MAEHTTIAWTHHTWNPWVGCTKVSPGCAHCYIERYLNHPFDGPKRTGRSAWGAPLAWDDRAARAGVRERVFTCSSSDFFHEGADAWRPEAWNVIGACPSLDWLVLTKGVLRPCPKGQERRSIEMVRDRLPGNWGSKGWPNVWLGVSVEDRDRLPRIDGLRSIPAAVRFLSIEPLLEYLGYPLDLTGIDWVIVGGESGDAFRPMETAWAESVRRRCAATGVAFFGKQRAGPVPGLPLVLDGEVVQQFPRR